MNYHPKHKSNSRTAVWIGAGVLAAVAIGALIFIIVTPHSPTTKEEARAKAGIVYDSSATEGGWDNLSPEEIEARNNDILKDYKAGVKVENIAVRYNVTPRFIAGLIQKYRAHHPLYRKNLRSNAKMRKKLPEEVCEGIAVEYQNGKSVSDIAKDHKIAVGQTYKILHDYGKLSESLAEAETRKVALLSRIM